MHDSEQPDESLRAAYRGLPRDEPPSAIDALVLGAARQSVVSPMHKWRVPVSLAAVLVLSVAVTLRVAEEQPEIHTAPPSPPASGQAASPVAPQPEPKVDARIERTAPPARAQPRPAPPPSRPLARQVPAVPAKEESSVFVPSPQADVSERRQGAGAPAAATEAALGQSAGQVAQPAARADRAAPRMAKSSAEASNLAAAAPPLTAEAWLERIIELRASARHKEADESYAEFRRRYPDYPIPPEKLQKIAPPLK